MKIIREGTFEYLRGQQASKIGTAKILALIGIPVLLLGFLIGYVGLFAGLILLTMSLKFYVSSTHYSSGIEGEKRVIEALKELDDSYYLINDITLGGNYGNIDHVVLSPKGVFIIETKNFSGKVRCYMDKWSKKGSRRVYPIDSVSKQAKSNAVRLGNFISKQTQIDIYVKPVCVFTDPTLELKAVRPTVPVLRLPELVPYMKGAYPNPSISDSKIQKITDCIVSHGKSHTG